MPPIKSTNENGKCMQHQFHQIQLQVNERKQDSKGKQQEPGAVRPQDDTDDPGEGVSQPTMYVRPEGDFSIYREPKLHPLLSNDDIERFFTTFERMAQVYRWPRDDWAIRLIPLLTGKAQSACLNGYCRLRRL